VAVATDVVQRTGYQSLRFGALADEVGIKKATLYYYFPTKADLGREVIRIYRRLMRAKLTEISQTETDPTRRLMMYIELYRGVIEDRSDHVCPGGMLAAEVLSLPSQLRSQMLDFFTDNEVWVSELLTELKPNWCDPMFTESARELIAILQGHLLMSRVYTSSSGFDRLCADIGRLLLDEEMEPTPSLGGQGANPSTSNRELA
jgi:TetR/AcrR family transcriptional repressor of nem operon